MNFTASRVICRQAEFVVFWSTPSASFSMSYSRLELARATFDEVCRRLVIRSASIWRGDEKLADYDLDPYAWHDPRLLVGR